MEGVQYSSSLVVTAAWRFRFKTGYEMLKPSGELQVLAVYKPGEANEGVCSGSSLLKGNFCNFLPSLWDARNFYKGNHILNIFHDVSRQQD